MRTDVPVGLTIAGAVLLLLVAMAVAPWLFTQVDPLLTDPLAAFQPPSAAHLFGTDQLGRDQFSRVIHGARLSLGMGFGATLIGLTAGLILGLLAGLSRGWVDRVLSRVIDVLYAFPEMLLAIIAVAVLGTGFSTLLLAIGIGSIPSYARVLRSQVLQVRSSGYAEAAVTLGQRARPDRVAARAAQLHRSRARAGDHRGGHGDHLRLGAQLRRARRAAADARVGPDALRQPQLPDPGAVARALAGGVPRRHRRLGHGHRPVASAPLRQPPGRSRMTDTLAPPVVAPATAAAVPLRAPGRRRCSASAT